MSETTPTHHVETFNCPNCGGDIQYDGQGVTQRCPYCGASVPVPTELRPKPAPSIKVINPISSTGPTRRTSNLGCVLIAGFVVFMILITVVLPIVLTNQALNSVPQIPGAVQEMVTAAADSQREPTRRPPTAAPSLTPTPAFADVAVQFGGKGMGPGQFTNAHLSGIDGEGRVYVG